MKGITYTILFGVLIATCLSTVSVREQLPNAQVIEGDRLSEDLRRVFNLSEASFPLEFNTNVGETFNASQPFAAKHYDRLGVKELNYVQQIHENFLAVVYDYSHVVFQMLNHDGNGFGPYVDYDFTKFGASLYCSDFAFNRPRFLMYVGCFDRSSTSTKPGSMFVFTYDFKSGNVTNEVSVPQKDGYRIMNRMKMFIHSFPQDGSNDDELYLVAYDQGHTSHNVTRRTNMLRVFHNVETGKLRYDTLVNTSMAGQTYDVIYDYFPYNGSLITTGRLAGVGEIITLAQCKLDLTDDKAICNPKFKATPVKSGAAIIHERGWYTEVDIDNGSIKWFKLEGKFSSASWNTHKMGEMDNVDFPKSSDIWIRDMSMSMYIGTITYSSRTHLDSGVTFMDWHSGASDYVSSYSGCVYDQNYVLAHNYDGSQQIKLLRNHMQIVVDSHYLDDGDNVMTLTASDSDNSASVTATITLMESIFEQIYIKNTIGIIDVHSNTVTTLVIDPKDIIVGNGINVEVTTEDETLLKAYGYSSEPARIVWQPSEIKKADWFFAKNKAVALNSFRTLVWGSCEDTHSFPNAYTCTEEGQFALPSGLSIQNAIYAHENVIMMYGTNSTGSTVVFMNEDGEAVPHFFDDHITDIAFMRTTTFFFSFLVFKDRVEIWTINKNDIEEFTFYEKISTEQYPKICPTGVSVPGDSMNRFSILSNCGFDGKFIFKWGLTHDVRFSAIPLSSHIAPVGFCDFGYEYLLRGYEEIYGLSGHSSFNKFTVPIDQLDGSVAYDMTCLESINQVAYAAHGTQGKNFTLSIQNGNMGYAQGRRFPTVIENIEAENIRSFDFMGSAFHVIENAGQSTFLQTYDSPRIRFHAGSVRRETDLSVTIRFYNKETEQFFVQIATVYPH